MRLSTLKIAGFKSFVDPTTIDMRSNLTGIVGPNGCGKSNTIDAVRWVMGESSAKHLRGASMDDVIFNGSSSRKPIGQATIELIFDNSDASLGGEYAKFSEIAIKRQISRDGQSKYFLNGTRCRRRDITDIFLGTGLGPRSYAIIEQGMISRLIEAKPEELRNTIEEAAGISKYKERRRETETRIRHTRENLERLSDIREELEKQLAHLDRQAKAAERFKKHKETERRLSAELLLLRLQQVQDDIVVRQSIINEKATQHQAQLAEQRSLENKIESKRTEHSESNNKLNKVQAEFYQVGSEISRIEQTIQHQKELETRYQRDLSQIEEELSGAKHHKAEDLQALETAKQQLATLEPQFKQQSNAFETASSTLQSAEQKLFDWQQQWNDLQQNLAEPTQQAQVERARMEQLENQIQHVVERLTRLQTDQGVFSTRSHKTELSEQQTSLSALKTKHQEAQQTFEKSKQNHQDQIDHNQSLQKELETNRSQLQSLTGRLASLEALQQAGLGKGSGGKLKQQFANWLSQHQLDKHPRLAESIEVEAGWETALETVLGDQLEAIQLDKSDQNTLQQAMQDAPDVSASFIFESVSSNPINKGSLAEKISQPIALQALLSHVFCADNINDAIKKQATLKSGEIIITREGILLGVNWLKKQGKDKQNQRDGVLARQKEIEDIQTQLNTLKNDVETQQTAIETGREALNQSDEQKSQLQNQLNSLHREQSQAQSKIDATQNRIKQTESNQQRIITEIAELELRHSSEQASHQSATLLRNKALTLMETLEKDKNTLQTDQQPLQDAVTGQRQQTQALQSTLQQTQIQLETYKANHTSAEQQLARFEDRLSQLEKRKAGLIEQQSGEEIIQQDELQSQLEQQIELRKQAETELTSARDNLQSIDNDIRQKELKRHEAENHVETFRTLLETLKLEWQEVSVREQTLQEQFDETEFDENSLKQSLKEDAENTSITLKSHQKALEDVQRKISHLGAINLAAIEEFKTQSERKIYLDQQNEDLVSALETLEAVISKIDRDTRNLFKDTFDKVNVRIQEMFPQLFGGGKAHLEMTGDDLLTTGISIMAQPPGKRISSIHLMSGGEKALTAVAMVFAIFELNPAPFCMLDEVDAPLDEANVGRFCELVRKMSERVQFIFITHNKTSMELADNLIGVTMREPGVSRLVSVDVNEAARMTQE